MQHAYMILITFNTSKYQVNIIIRIPHLIEYNTTSIKFKLVECGTSIMTHDVDGS